MNMKRFVRIIAMCVCVALLLTGIALLQPGRALAQNNARDYIPAPSGILAILTYYEHVSADRLNFKGNKVTGNLGLSENIGIFRPIYYCDTPELFGVIPSFRVAPQAVIPFGSASFNGTPFADVTSSGFAPPFILSQIWFINNNTTKTYLGFAPFFYFPLGNYSNTRPINLGQNRWQFRQELNFTKGFEVIPGHYAYAEVTVAGHEYTNNSDANAFNQTLSQSPNFSVESHLSYDLTKTVFASVDYYGNFLGSQTLGNVNLDNPTNSNNIGGTVAYSFAPGFQLMLQYRGDVAVESGPKTQTILARFLWATDLNSLMGNPQAKQ
jgi:hypothetical protein